MIPSIRARWFAVSVAALSLLAVGCGGPSAKDFARQGNAICTSARTKAQAVPRAKDFPGLSRQSRATLAIVQDGVDRFHKLAPPAEKKADFEHYLQLADQQVALARQLPAAADAKDVARIQQLAGQGRAQQTQIRPLFARLGFTECGKAG